MRLALNGCSARSGCDRQLCSWELEVARRNPRAVSVGRGGRRGRTGSGVCSMCGPVQGAEGRVGADDEVGREVVVVFGADGCAVDLADEPAHLVVFVGWRTCAAIV